MARVIWSVIAGFFARLLGAAGFARIAVAVAAACPHERVTRYWFRAHYFQRVCQDCRKVLETGRDKAHRYPDDAEGVNRGVRAP